MRATPAPPPWGQRSVRVVWWVPLSPQARTPREQRPGAGRPGQAGGWLWPGVGLRVRERLPARAKAPQREAQVQVRVRVQLQPARVLQEVCRPPAQAPPPVVWAWMPSCGKTRTRHLRRARRSPGLVPDRAWALPKPLRARSRWPWAPAAQRRAQWLAQQPPRRPLGELALQGPAAPRVRCSGQGWARAQKPPHRAAAQLAQAPEVSFF